MFTNKYIKKQIEIITKRKYERLIKGLIALLLIFISQLVQNSFNIISMITIAIAACILIFHELEIIAVVSYMKRNQEELMKEET